MITRRRFLSLTAAFACAPHLAQAASWQGRALGAEVSITLHGPRALTEVALADMPARLDQIEALFSLYRSDSVLSRLNRSGRQEVPPLFSRLLHEVDAAHRLTGGLFDPTVQPLWQALARGDDPAPARALIGWDRVQRTASGKVTLARGQQLTLNGIAQGFATDLIREDLGARGFTKALIDIGEQAALGGPFRLGLSDPRHGHLGQRSLTDSAIATSSPGALLLGTDRGHILSPDGRPALWSTLSIEARSATQADALSTAAVFMPLDALRALKNDAGLQRITAVSGSGDIRTL